MAKNYMEEVAKMLGVSLGEEFKLKIRETEIAHSIVYHFTNRGLIAGNEAKCSGNTLTEILVGRYEIVKPKKVVKMPFKPKYEYLPIKVLELAAAEDSVKLIAELQEKLKNRENTIKELETQLRIKDEIIHKQTIMMCKQGHKND